MIDFVCKICLIPCCYNENDPPFHAFGHLHCHICVPKTYILSSLDIEEQILVSQNARLDPKNPGWILLSCDDCSAEMECVPPTTLQDIRRYNCIFCKGGCGKDFEWRYVFDMNKYKDICNEIVDEKIFNQTPEEKMNKRRDQLLKDFLLS